VHLALYGSAKCTNEPSFFAKIFFDPEKDNIVKILDRELLKIYTILNKSPDKYRNSLS